MAVQNLNPVTEQQARFLAEENRKAEPDITRVFFGRLKLPPKWGSWSDAQDL